MNENWNWQGRIESSNLIKVDCMMTEHAMKGDIISKNLKWI